MPPAYNYIIQQSVERTFIYIYTLGTKYCVPVPLANIFAMVFIYFLMECWLIMMLPFTCSQPSNKKTYSMI